MPAKPCPPNGSGSRPRHPPKDCTGEVAKQGRKQAGVEWARGQRRGGLEGGGIGQRTSWAQRRQSRAQEPAKTEDLGKGSPAGTRFGVFCLGLVVPACLLPELLGTHKGAAKAEGL